MQIPLARLFSRGAPAEPTFGSVADEWLDSTGTNVKRSTRSVYSTVAAKYIPRWLQVKPVSRVTAGDIQQLLYEAEHPPGREPLSASRMRTICTVINAILSFARDKGLDAAAHYQPRRSPGAAGPEVNPLTKDEQTALESWLLDNMGESSLGVLICLYTGLRLGEICAMKWGDVSFADSSLKVQRTVQRVRVPDAGPDAPRTRLVFDSPKSASSNRTVPLPGFLLELMFSMRGSDEAFILTGSDRHCLEPRTYQNRFYAILRDAGVRRVNFHFCDRLCSPWGRPKNFMRDIGPRRRCGHSQCVCTSLHSRET